MADHELLGFVQSQRKITGKKGDPNRAWRRPVCRCGWIGGVGRESLTMAMADHDDHREDAE